uniref:CRAL-TRIO domain-containing protein n=1 Tax=Heliothis virescens TaxID=7102 RepID=A0A2A4IVC3_HELVI
MKQIVSEKIGKRFEVQNSLEGLYKVVPKEILPIEYGGNERSTHELQEELLNELSLESNVKYIEMMSKAGTDESKRHASKFNEEYMGMPGCFRNLSVD